MAEPRLRIFKTDKNLKGKIRLDGSKSISNRALIIRALSGGHFPLKNLSNSQDTHLLKTLLNSDAEILDAGAAGTTFRFLTAYLALQDDTRILTGNERMKLRPVGLLVQALRQLGADIGFLEKEGFPPLRIKPFKYSGASRLVISSETSSQFISAILMIAPCLPNGLELELQGVVVSRSYIEMTLKLMAHFGISSEWKNNLIHVPPGTYRQRNLTIEADWSAASYFYAMAAFSEECDLQLEGLYKNSLQGDAMLPAMMEQFGVKTSFQENSVFLTKSPVPLKPFEWDFLSCPDLAQTIAVVCGGLGVQGLFTGLHTLRIKETDRIAALQHELAKINVFFSKLPAGFSKKSQKEYFMLEGKAAFESVPVFSTYDDHRMAMAFATLSMLGKVVIEQPEVVKKSYPDFWKDLKNIGFSIHAH